MEWIRARIETTSVGVEAVTGVLLSHGVSGMEIVDSQERARYFADTTRTWDYADESLLVADSDCAYVVFYTTKDAEGERFLKSVADALANLQAEYEGLDIGTLALYTESADDETWLHEWKKHFKPLRIGRVVVVPKWEDFSPVDEDIIFKIDPGAAFGTGQHQTTQLCINAVQEWCRAGDRVLDVGCGSGILSIISLLLGASFVCAIDVDPAGAVAATKNNAKLNPVDIGLLNVMSGDVLTDEETRKNVGYDYDVVVANIVADVIIPLVPFVGGFAKKGGIFIASGIIDDRLKEVLETFESHGMSIIGQGNLDGWNCVAGRVNGHA